MDTLTLNNEGEKTTVMEVKILHIINDLSRNGGAQRFVIDLVCPPPQGYDIRVITLDDDNDFTRELTEAGVPFYVWNKLSLKEKWQLLRWPDVVHGHLFPSIYIALAAVGKRHIQTEHATHNRRRDHGWMKPFEWLLYWRYDVTACITGQVRDALTDFLPHWKKHYRVILNGVDLSKFSLREKAAPAESNTVRIGMVGRFHTYKDHPTLFRALTHLPSRFEVHLAGDGDRREEYQALAASLGIEDRVVFHGVRADIPAFLDSLDIYVQSAVVEGFGLAAVEAMAAGLPVLASDVPGLSEVVERRDYRFPVGDDNALAGKILALCDDADTYAKASDYAVQRCQDFTLKTFRDQYYRTYRELAGAVDE